MFRSRVRCFAVSLLGLSFIQVGPGVAEEKTQAANHDVMREIQVRAAADGKSDLGYWGTDPENFFGWKTHSNRLIPVYAFGTKGAGKGIDLNSYRGKNSPYRSEEELQKIYGFIPDQTVDAEATWMDQTNIADIQMAAAAAGRKYIFLVVFDGMDWQTTQAAAIYNSGVIYTRGKGAGTHFQDYDAAGTAQYSFMVTSPHNEGTDADATTQQVTNPGGTIRGGYNATAAGRKPWEAPSDPGYLIAKPSEGSPKHAYTDSSSSASSMTAAVKIYNGSVNVDATGQPVTTIAHRLQEEGFAVGAVSSVPISHATPAAAYAHNVTRQDYQDLTRDMIGRPSVQHPSTPLPGMDVVIGGGYGTEKPTGKDQGDNYVSGNIYLDEADLKAIDVANGGRYVTAVRTEGKSGAELLAEATTKAVNGHHRLLGFFGVGKYNGHLPFATADGNYDPAPGVGRKAEAYSEGDLKENPTLSQMTESAIAVLSTNEKGFWLMVESGDVDWANHDDNIDCSIGAVNSGAAAVKTITDWVEKHSNWSESIVIVTADHGHMWNLTNPQMLANLNKSAPKQVKP
ncbi:MAG: alkaline phosphatase [Planctomycetaceae bacterium]